jgi:hypothetical protein
MFKSLNNLVKSENAKWIFVAIVVSIMIYSFMMYSNGKTSVLDNYTGYDESATKNTGSNVNDNAPLIKTPEDVSAAVKTQSSATAGDYKLADTNDPGDLLPPDSNSQWAASNPSSNTTGQMPDLLNAVSRIGLDSIGQTMKNANLQIRSDPAIVKQNVGPWNNSTFEADNIRTPLELGGN